MTIKDKLFAAAFDLYMKYGVKSVSMDDICRHLGVSKKTLYTIIDSKGDLIQKTIDLHIKKDEEDIAQITQNSDTAIDEMITIGRHILQFLRAMKPSLIYDLKKYYPQSWKSIEDKHYNFIYKTVKTNLIRGQNEGLYLSTFNPEIIAQLYVEKSHCVADEENFPSNKFSRFELFQEMLLYHMRGIISAEGQKVLDNLEL